MERSRFKCRMPVARSLDPRQPLLPEIIQPQGRLDVPQAILGDVTLSALGQQSGHVHPRDTVAFGRLDAKSLAIKIQVESPRRALPAADTVESELLRQVAMRFGLKPVTEPVFARDGDVQERGAE